VYGLSFVLAMMCAALALAALRRPRRDALWILALPALYLLPALPPPRNGVEDAVVVQPNVSQDAQWTPQALEAFETRVQALSLTPALRAGERPARMILWPELPAPLYFFEDRKLRDGVATLARLTRAHVLLGVVGRAPGGGPTNSAVMIAPSGEALGRYDKIRLVPFGEYVPAFFGFVNKISTEAGNFVPGERVVVYRAGDRKVGAFICYESVFPDLIRQFARDGAEVFVNLSNDGYFARSAAREQHLKIARMRAAENRRWLIRATNDGITAVIDPAGRIAHRLEPYVELSARVRYAYETELTPYTRYGDWFAWICLAAGLALAGAGALLPGKGQPHREAGGADHGQIRP
jgi:apolipoprotein N-acyltransferase